MLELNLNKVGVKINGEVYEFYKVNFGLQRQMMELQKAGTSLVNSLKKKYDVENASDIEKLATEEEKLEMMGLSLKMQEALKSVAVNEKSEQVLDKLDVDSAQQLMGALV